MGAESSSGDLDRAVELQGEPRSAATFELAAAVGSGRTEGRRDACSSYRPAPIPGTAGAVVRDGAGRFGLAGEEPGLDFLWEATCSNAMTWQHRSCWSWLAERL
jgi:hypothetical protein